MKRPKPEQQDSLDLVREGRKRATPAESKLWKCLRARQFRGRKFRRQIWIGPFIADFLCAEDRLIIEVDGDSHALQVDYDLRRTEWLAREGFRVVRFTNSEVMHNLEGVLDQLASELPSPSQPAAPAGPLPLPLRERG